MSEQNTVTIDGETYEISSLSQKIQQLISIYRKWEAELSVSRLEVIKGEAAMRDLSRELAAEMKAEVGTKEESQRPLTREQLENFIQGNFEESFTFETSNVGMVQFAQFVEEIEREFRIEISDEILNRPGVQTVGSLIDALVQ